MLCLPNRQEKESEASRKGFRVGFFFLTFCFSPFFSFQQSSFYQLLHAGWPVSLAIKQLSVVQLFLGLVSWVFLSPGTSSVKFVLLLLFFFLIQRKPGAPGPPGHPGKAGAPVSKKTPGVPSVVGCCWSRCHPGAGSMSPVTCKFLGCPEKYLLPGGFWHAVITGLGIGFQRSLMGCLSASHRNPSDV